jgi:uncharacterized protein
MLKQILLLAGRQCLLILAVSIPTLITGLADMLKSPALLLIVDVLAIALCLFVYRFMMGRFGAAVPAGLHAVDWRRRFTQGCVLGAILALIYFVPTYLGFFKVEIPASYHVLNNLLIAMAYSLTAGFIEEIIFRGIIFGLSEPVLGTGIALAMQAALFGLAHLARPDVQWADVAEMMCAGLLFGAAYVVTRTLWLSIGMHFAFDWLVMLQPGAIEAMDKKSIPYTATEMILLTLFACLEIAIAWRMLKQAREQGKWVAPVWKMPAVAKIAENESA